MAHFNLDNTFNFDAQVEKGCKARVSHLWNVEGNCIQDRLGVQRWAAVKAACEFLLRDSSAVSVSTECGVLVSRGFARIA